VYKKFLQTFPNASQALRSVAFNFVLVPVFV
jgi:hypothetical protein